MRVHRADEREQERWMDFLNQIELALDGDTDNYKDCDENDPNRIKIERILQEIAKEEHFSPEDVDGRILMYEFLKRNYNPRIFFCGFTAGVLLDNCTDPTKDYLDFPAGTVFLHVAPEQ